MQLVAFGAQDVYLTANPQITFFKVVYRRHTNFAMESIEQVFNGAADFGRKITATMSRNGDLIGNTYLRVELPSVTVNPGYSFRWLNWIGHILIKSVEVEIGGQRIDKQYGDWMHIWNELTQTAGHQIGYANMVGNVPALTSIWTASKTASLTVPGKVLYIPLEFWWNRNPGLAMPLIALQYHEVRLTFELANVKDCYWSGHVADASASPPVAYSTDMTTTAIAQIPSLVSCSLFVDFIYLDTDERRRFAQASHEYLISQIQFTGEESTSQTNNRFKLSFNHPTKELIWVVQPIDNITDNVAPYGKQWFNYTDAFDTSADPAFVYATDSTMPALAAGGGTGVFVPTTFGAGQNPVATALLQLNGHDRLSIRDGDYFNLVQPYQHHENVPSAGINVYSFAIKPEEHQCSGTCNFSRIDSATLQLNLTPATVTSPSGTNSRSANVRVYAVNYNVLRIMSGMGGLAYSN
jgi:hypothetical protein